MNQASLDTEKLNQRLTRGSKHLFIWTLAWLISTASVAFGPKLLWDFNVKATLLAIAINLGLGIKMILVFKSHLQDMDEMQRKVHFNAMAISLGCTLIFGNIFGMLQPAGLVASTPSPSNILFVTGISYIVAVFVNFKRYL